MESVPIVILGAGRLGRALVRQLVESAPFHAARHGFVYRVTAWADSTGLFTSPEGIAFGLLLDLAAAKDAGAAFASRGADAAKGSPGDHAAAAAAPESAGRGGPPPILVDATSSPDTAEVLASALDRGWRVVTANKLPLAGPQALFDRLTSTTRFRYEATVGSAVPVIEACLGLLRAGDEPRSFVGALSGTLGYLSTGLEDGEAFSSLLRTAWERGYTEKDPRVDLGGKDVGRKALILARSLGFRMEAEEVGVEALFPEDMAGLSVEAFVEASRALDGGFAERVSGAKARGGALRYAAEFRDGRISVGMREVPKASALGALRGNDNLLALTTRHYPTLPLILQGRGNGVEAAAAGVHGDIVALGEDRGR